MAIHYVLNTFKSIFFFFVTIWRRALCCFRRRRRISDSVPLTTIGVVPDYSNSASNDADTWNSWDESSEKFKPNSIQEHIEMYRQQTIAARNLKPETSEENPENLFEDMTPRITKQTKVFIDDGVGEGGRNGASRLSLAPQHIVAAEGELGEWDESSGWEEQTQTDWDPQSILREKRRQERERRIWEQQQRRQERVSRPLSLGAKIS